MIIIYHLKPPPVYMEDVCKAINKEIRKRNSECKKNLMMYHNKRQK